jgi:hypothetical protein
MYTEFAFLKSPCPGLSRASAWMAGSSPAMTTEKGTAA